MDPNSGQRLRVRGGILTIGIAAITIMGSIYGAQLKSEQEVKKQKTRYEKPSVEVEDELIATLQTRKLGLAMAKESWEKKATALRLRMESNKQRTLGGRSSSGDDGVEARPAAGTGK